MVEKSTHTVVVMPGLINLVRRPDSLNWQAHYKVENHRGWVRKGTKTSDLAKATQFAIREQMKAELLVESGRPITSKKFKQVAGAVAKAIEMRIAAGTFKPVERDYLSAINRWLIPYYGNINVDCITPSDISGFHEYRAEKVGRELSSSAQNNHNSAFNMVMNEAIERGYMTEYKRPTLKNTGAATGRRAEFAKSELLQLLGSSDEWIESAHMEKTKQIRRVVKYYVPFLACTGMRAGTETEHMVWANIKRGKDAKGKDQLEIRIKKGKRGARALVAGMECWLYLDKLRELNPKLKDMALADVLAGDYDMPVFGLPDGTYPDSYNKPFRVWLESEGLLKPKGGGEDRSLYSLRHYYATQMLYAGKNKDWLAHQMGTSTAMLDKHYGHINPLLLGSEFSGASLDESPETEMKVRLLMEQQIIAQGFMEMAEVSTGLTLSLSLHNEPLRDEFEQRLKARLKQQA